MLSRSEIYGMYTWNDGKWCLDKEYCERNFININIYPETLDEEYNVPERKYMYIIVRNDLSSPQKTVQATHATIEALVKYREYFDSHPKVVVVLVKSEYKLLELEKKLPFEHVHFNEANLNNQMTAIATVPLNSIDREYFRKYALLY